MRIVLIVLLVLVLLGVLVCMTGVVIVINFRGGKLDWYAHYCGFRIYPRAKKAVEEAVLDEAEQKPSIKDKLKSRFKKNENGKSEKEKKLFPMDKLWKMLQNIAEKADMAGSAFYALPKPMQDMIRKIVWYDIETDFLIGDEDAAKCALLYGKVQSLLHPLLGQTGAIMKVRRKKIAIVCDFTADSCRWDFGCRFRIPVGTLVKFGIGMAFGYFSDSKKAGAQTSGVKL